MNISMRITSRENPLVKQICSLQTSAKARRESGLFLLEGLRICKDAYENGIRFEKLVVSDGAAGKYAEEISLLSGSAEQCVNVTDELFKKMSDTDSPQGIMALTAIPEKKMSPSKGGRYIGLENLADPSNLGAVSRTAEALGVSGMVLCGCTDPYSPKALRASMGTLLRVPLYFSDNLIDTAKNCVLRSIACVVDRQARSVASVDFCDGDLLMIGNEANGLTENTKKSADISITVPMAGRAESLNAAAAAAIVMWEMMRR